MTTLEIALVVGVAAIIVLVVGNLVFSRIAERKNPPVGSFMGCDGIRLHYLDCGVLGAPCIVLFHGNGSMIQDFIISGLVELLARNYRVVCFDRPGFGYSQRPRSRIWTATAQADLFAKALDQLAVSNPVVLGHSWGTLGYRLGLARRVFDPWSRPCVRILLSDLAIRRMDHGRARDPDLGRSGPVYSRADHLVGDSPNCVPKAV